ncbi:MAG: hypothetical protein V3S16_01850 [Candidatus Desulfatibia sp.]|uniref:hypothetical protein n=1 Tax=Candidatus Desulfatibia sp. TaxID=3101189 RepID=UPI002F3472C3
MKKIVFALLLYAFLSTTAGATPSSLIRIPSVDVQPYGTVHLGIDINTAMYKPRGADSTGNANVADDYEEPTDFGLTFGMLDTGIFQVEFGFDIREPTDEPVYVNFKVAIPEGAIANQMPGFAIGGYSFGTDVDTNYNIFYIETAKTFSFMGRFTFGYFGGNTEHLRNINDEADHHGMLFGFDRRLPEVNERLWFGIDYQQTFSEYGAWSLGVSWAFSENAALVIGFIRYNDERMNRDKMTWQIDFDF